MDTSTDPVAVQVAAVGPSSHGPSRCGRPWAWLLDLESILVPEIWEAVAHHFGLPELLRTTRDVPDYDALMQERIAVALRQGLRLSDLRSVVAGIEPLPGAEAFLAWARRRGPVVVVSDTFWQLAEPLLAKLGNPTLLCHGLEVDAEGFVRGWRPRVEDSKRAAVRGFRALGYAVAAVGDSFNDVGLLVDADLAAWLRPPPGVAALVPGAVVVQSLEELRAFAQH